MTPADRLFIFLLLLASTICESLVLETDDGFHKSQTTLLQVAVLHRHGFRAPERTFPSDPYNNGNKYWPQGWGQLMPEGKSQLFKLGEILSKRYSKLIDHYSAEAVLVNSSDYDRCHMSAALLLAGWFPPEGDQIWSDNLLWQPIPIHSVPISQDWILAQEAPCPKYSIEKDKIDKEVKENETEEDRKLYKYLTKNMGEPITQYHQLETYYLTLQIEERVGYRLPEWTKTVYPEKIRQKALLSLESHAWNKFMQRLKGGPLLKDILGNFNKRSQGITKEAKVFIYSAHDTTIVNVLRALQFTKKFWPGFGSALVFELHQSKDKNFIVKLFFTNSTIKSELVEWEIPNCQKACSLKTLNEVTKYVRSVDWVKDCAL